MFAISFLFNAWRRTKNAALNQGTNKSNDSDTNFATKITAGKLILVVFIPFAAGYFLSYLFRSTNAIIAPQLTSEVGLDAGDLGFLTATYFLTFSLFQIPLGILLDRYGPRKVQMLLLLFAAGGAVLFSLGTNTTILALGRGFIGLGVAGCLMGAVKAATIWFDDRHWPLINGSFLAIGGLGAVAATAPLEIMLAFFTWREIFQFLAIATLSVSLLIFIIVPERKTSIALPTLRHQIFELGSIYTNQEFWKCAPLISTSLAANMAIQGLWAGPWLKDVASLARGPVAHYLLLLALALAVGSLITGALANWLEKFKVSLLTFFTVSMLLFMISQLLIIFELAPTSIYPWLAFGLLANSAMVVYAHLTRFFPNELSGRVITAVNVMTFGGVFLIQYLIGEIINFFPTGENGEYSSKGFFWGFGLALLAQFLSFIWFILPRSAKVG